MIYLKLQTQESNPSDVVTETIAEFKIFKFWMIFLTNLIEKSFTLIVLTGTRSSWLIEMNSKLPGWRFLANSLRKNWISHLWKVRSTVLASLGGGVNRATADGRSMTLIVPVCCLPLRCANQFWKINNLSGLRFKLSVNLPGLRLEVCWEKTPNFGGFAAMETDFVETPDPKIWVGDC